MSTSTTEQTKGSYPEPEPRSHDLDGGILVLALGGVVLGLTSARRIDLSAMNDLGLASVLPVTYWSALVMICVAFALALTREPVKERLLAIPALALALNLFGVVPFATAIPRDHVSFRHIGVIEHLTDAGWIDGSIDAYFNWPAFFSLNAFVNSAAGDPNLLAVARWAPLGARIVLIASLLLLMRALLADRRAAWVGVWIAMLWDWVDQDYFAPQTYDLALHYIVLSLVVGWLMVERARGPLPPHPPRQRVGIYLIALGLSLAAIPAHQLTPVVSVLTLGALAATRRLPFLGLPVVTALGVAVWLATGAHKYQSGHELLTIPDFSSLFGANVSSRVGGSELHHWVVLERMAFSAALWGLAGLGFLRAWRAKQPLIVPTVLAVVPFALLPMQAYGGEMLLRVQLFALPGMAVLAVRLLAPPGGNRVRSAVLVLAVSLVALPALIIARYGNDLIETFTPAEVAAVDALYDAVPEGGLLVSAVPYTPWRDRNYADYDYVTIVDLAEETSAPSEVWGLMIDSLEEAGTGGVIVTRTAYEAAAMLGDAADLSSIEWGLANDPRFELVFSNSDGDVYVFRGGNDG